MANLDDLIAQIPIQDIASQLGADEGEVGSTIQTLVPVLVSGLQHNAQDAGSASGIESAATAAQGLLDGHNGQVNVGQIDAADGLNAVAHIFGGNDAGQVASAVSGAGGGNNDLMAKLLPILAPIVLAYIGKQLSQKKEPAEPAQQASGGGLGDVLGSILGGAGGGGGTSMGSILGNMLGGKTGGAIGEVLGGLLGGKK